MITKLKANTKYRLIDKQGYIDSHFNNADFLRRFYINDHYLMQEISHQGAGIINGSYIMNDREFKFFEEVLQVFDGSTPLEVGMLAKIQGIDHSREILFICPEGQLVVYKEQGSSSSYTCSIKQVGVYDLRRQKFIDEIVGNCLPVVKETARDVAELCYDKFKKEFEDAK